MGRPGTLLVDSEGEGDAGSSSSCPRARGAGDRSAALEVVTLLREGLASLDRAARARARDLGDDSLAVRDALARALDDDVIAVRTEAALSLGLLHDARGVAIGRRAAPTTTRRIGPVARCARWCGPATRLKVEPLIEGVRALRLGIGQQRFCARSTSTPRWTSGSKPTDDPGSGPRPSPRSARETIPSLLPWLASLASARYPVTARAIPRGDGRPPRPRRGRRRSRPRAATTRCQRFTSSTRSGDPRAVSKRSPRGWRSPPNRPRSVRWSGPLATRGLRRLYLAVEVAGEAEGTLHVGAQGVAVRPGAQVVVIDASEPPRALPPNVERRQ
ncbi:MAG: hypothetical protein R3A52_04430 [Polyangiales bacterium]